MAFAALWVADSCFLMSQIAAPLMLGVLCTTIMSEPANGLVSLEKYHEEYLHS